MAATNYDFGSGKPSADPQTAIDLIPGDLGALGGIQSVRGFAGGTTLGGGTGYRYDQEPDMDTGFSNESNGDYLHLKGMVINQGLRDYGIVIRGTGGGSYLTLGKHSKVSDISITQNAAGTAIIRGIETAKETQLIERCMVYDLVTTGAGNSLIGISVQNGNGVVRNCMVMNISSQRFTLGIQIYNMTTGKCYNNSLFRIIEDGAFTGTGIQMHTMTNAYVKNCVVAFVVNTGADYDCVSVANGFGGNNISEDETAGDFGGTGNLINQHITNDIKFTNINAGAEDLHIQSDSVAVSAGVDLSGEGYTDDIDGDTRTNWDSGADEIPVVPTDTERAAELGTALHAGGQILLSPSGGDTIFV